MRAHSDEEILRKVLETEKFPQDIEEDKIDIAVDLDDEHDVCHTYAVTFQRKNGEWDCLQIEEISSL